MKIQTLVASVVTTLAATAAMAQTKPNIVPEIDAMAGVAAVAAVAGVVALVRERMKG